MLIEQIERVRRMDQLIRLHSTGNSEEFAQKLKISKKHVYNLIEELKDAGASIRYDRNQRSFVYDSPHFVESAFKVVEIAPDELMAIGGGAVLCVCNEHPAIFLKNL